MRRCPCCGEMFGRFIDADGNDVGFDKCIDCYEENCSCPGRMVDITSNQDEEKMEARI